MPSETLQNLLFKKLPQYRHPRYEGTVDVRKLSKELGVTIQSVYRWFNLDIIPKEWVPKLSELSGGKLNEANMLKYTYKSTKSCNVGPKGPRKITETL